MTIHRRQPPPSGRQPESVEPEDNPFLERLFEVMCRHIFVLDGESFVEQLRRRLDALRLTAEMKPRSEEEWLLAADITMKHLFAVHCLVLGRGKGLRMKERLEYGREFIAHSKSMHAAQLRYELHRARSKK